MYVGRYDVDTHSLEPVRPQHDVITKAAFVLKLAQVEDWPMLCELLDKAAMDSTVYNAFSTLLGSLGV